MTEKEAFERLIINFMSLHINDKHITSENGRKLIRNVFELLAKVAKYIEDNKNKLDGV